ncbi:AAEL007837-PA, partial [Aedes aegypti]
FYRESIETENHNKRNAAACVFKEEFRWLVNNQHWYFCALVITIYCWLCVINTNLSVSSSSHRARQAVASCAAELLSSQASSDHVHVLVIAGCCEDYQNNPPEKI